MKKIIYIMLIISVMYLWITKEKNNMLPKETYGGTIEKHTENGGVNDWEETEQSKSAYMLVYERVKKSPLTITKTKPVS